MQDNEELKNVESEESEKEKCKLSDPDDTVSPDDRYSDEINTYDLPPLSKESQKKNCQDGFFPFLRSILSVAAFVMFFLTMIFSATELLEIIVDDMGAGNMILGRIFGKTAIDGDGNNLCDIIIKQNFIVLEKESSSADRFPEGSDVENPPLLPVESEVEKNESYSTTEPAPPESSPTDEKRFPILPMDISLISYGSSFIYNDTSLTPNISELSEKKLKKYAISDAPLVLVIHTHATESYMPEGSEFYIDDGNELSRSHDVDENMIAVGKEFVRVLTENGIPTLHCTTIHDKDSYRESYSRAAESIAKYLEEYPSIRYVFDLHRDSLLRSTGELISAVSYIGGETCAQIMPVVGSGFSGWEDNMTFALRLRSNLNDSFINLCRPVCLRESNYNQGMSSVSLLIEIGTSGNTLREAKKAAAITAEAIADIIKYQN